MLATAASEETSTKPHLSFRPDVQGLRAVAVVLVVLSHVGIKQVAGGYIGVDVFFVVSGFLITGLLMKEANNRRGISLIDFYARRARRILPAATLVLLATIGASFVLLGSIRAGEIARETLWAAGFALNWKFSLSGTDYFANDLPPSPIQHYWSLAVEEQFYLFWPALLLIVLFAFARRRRSEPGTYVHRPSASRWVMLGAVIAVIIAASLTYSVIFTAHEAPAAYFSTFTRAWELGIGASLAIFSTQLSRLPDLVKAALAWIGLIGIVVSAVMLTGQTPFPGTAALFPVLSAALVIGGGIGVPRYGPVTLLGTAPFRFIGDRSYSLYLWHWPVLIIGAAYVGHNLSLLQGGVLVLVALLLTMATYTFFEYPIHAGALKPSRGNSLLFWPTSFVVLGLVVLLSLDAVRTAPGYAAGPIGFGPPAAATTAAGESAVPADPGTTSTDPVQAAVAAAVASAQAGDPVPDVLTPPLDQLRDDNWEVDAPCAAAFNEATSDVCKYGADDAAHTMVIIGDSHAGMWLATLRHIAETSGWKVYYFIKGGCTVSNVVQWSVGRDERSAVCTDWRTWAIGEIAKLSPDLTMISHRGTRQGEPVELTAADGSLMPTEDTVAAWEAGMVSTVQTLKQSSKRVVIFSETPQSEQDPLGCLDKPGQTLSKCTFEVDQAVKNLNDANERAAAAAGGEFLNFTPWLCSNNVCPPIVNGLVVRYDLQHVTNTYGLALSDTLKAALAIT